MSKTTRQCSLRLCSVTASSAEPWKRTATRTSRELNHLTNITHVRSIVQRLYFRRRIGYDLT
jgi:hypothetical protein